MSDIWRSMRDYCNTYEFENKVRSIINRENYFKNFLEDYLRTSAIESHVSRVADVTVKEKILSHCNNFVDNELPKIVNKIVEKKLDKKIPEYLDNNNKMKDILEEQTDKLKNNLYEVSEKVMSDIVKEPGYNKMLDLHLKQMQEKNEIEFNKQMIGLKQNYLQELSQLEEKCKSMQTDINILGIVLGASLFASLTILIN
jgi:hypothetical protein